MVAQADNARRPCAHATCPSRQGGREDRSLGGVRKAWVARLPKSVVELVDVAGMLGDQLAEFFFRPSCLARWSSIAATPERQARPPSARDLERHNAAHARPCHAKCAANLWSASASASAVGQIPRKLCAFSNPPYNKRWPATFGPQ